MSVETHDDLTGAQEIASERTRQLAEERWLPEHDNGHRLGELATAAACYAMPPASRIRYTASPPFEEWRELPPISWPWDYAWWKPSNDRMIDLIKAGALIAAEIDRLKRTVK